MAEEQISQEVNPQPQPVIPPVPEITPEPQGNRLKIILFSVLGILVFAGAVFGAYKLGQKQVQPGSRATPTPVAVATPTPLPSEAPAKEGDPTANWKTYMNKDYGFEVRYPESWVIKSPAYPIYEGGPERTGNAHPVLGLAPGAPRGDWAVLLTVIPSTIDELLNDPNYYWNQLWQLVKRESIFVGSMPAEKVTWSNTAKIIYIQNPSGSLTIQFDGVFNEFIKEADQILSTFKFLPSADSTGSP